MPVWMLHTGPATSLLPPPAAIKGCLLAWCPLVGAPDRLRFRAILSGWMRGLALPVARRTEGSCCNLRGPSHSGLRGPISERPCYMGMTSAMSRHMDVTKGEVTSIWRGRGFHPSSCGRPPLAVAPHADGCVPFCSPVGTRRGTPPPGGKEARRPSSCATSR